MSCAFGFHDMLQYTSIYIIGSKQDLPAILIVIESRDVIPVHSTSVLCIDIAAITETVDSK